MQVVAANHGSAEQAEIRTSEKRKLFKLFKLRDALMAVLSKLRYALQKK
jgi:hypothetical protein